MQSDMSDLLRSWLAMPCDWADGLTEAEVSEAATMHSLRFPPDLRTLLQSRLPCGPQWPDWRHPETVADRLTWPWEGAAFDIEENAFWLDEFDPRPSQLEEALRVARPHFDAAPKLIPIFAHRSIVSVPHAPGNPILSVYQTDIICYGLDLADWISREFGPKRSTSSPSLTVDLGLWTRIMYSR